MARHPHLHLSRRERQIMDVIYRLGQATATEVRQQLPDPPSYSAVRALLRILEEKGHLKHQRQGPRYLFRPIVTRDRAKRTALKRLVQTFFDGSTEQAVATLLQMGRPKLSSADLDRLAKLIEDGKKKGR